MKSKKLRARDLPLDFTRDDYPRRFRNALLALMRAHPRGLQWIQEQMPRRLLSTWDHPEVIPNIPEYVTLLESTARYLVLKPYGFFQREQISGLLFRNNWPFNDEGRLPPG